MNRFLFLVGCLALTVCLQVNPSQVQAADGTPKTAPASPEVVIKGRSAKEIRAATAKFFIGRGYTEKDGPNGELIYQKPRDNPDGASDAKQCLRIRVRIGKPEKNSIKVMSRSFGVDNCGTAKEKEVPTPAAYSQIQAFLGEIKMSLVSK